MNTKSMFFVISLIVFALFALLLVAGVNEVSAFDPTPTSAWQPTPTLAPWPWTPVPTEIGEPPYPPTPTIVIPTLTVEPKCPPYCPPPPPF